MKNNEEKKFKESIRQADQVARDEKYPTDVSYLFMTREDWEKHIGPKWPFPDVETPAGEDEKKDDL